MAKSKDKPHRKREGASKEALTTKGRVVLSTGGGEPIPKGQKWTDEEREEDAPRTDDGKFATKSSIGKTTKYVQHAWRGTYEKGHPLNPNGKKLSEDQKKKIWEKEVKETPDIGKDVEQHYAKKMEGTIKAGTKIAINDAIFIAAIDISVEDFKDYLRYAWEGDEEKLGALSEAFIRKKGARTKAEKAALDKVKSGKFTDNENKTGKRDPMLDPYRMEVVVDEKDNEEMAKLSSPETKKKVADAAKAYQDRLEKGFPKYDMSAVVKKASLDPNGAKYKNNAAFNAKAKAALAGKIGTPTPAPAPAPAPATPTSASAKPNEILNGGLSEAKADSGKFYNDNKEVFDQIADALSDDTNKLTGKDIVDAYVNGEISDADIYGLFE